MLLKLHQIARGGAVQSQNFPGGTDNGPAGSSARGHGSSAGGSVLPVEAYRRRHEITVTVSFGTFYWTLFWWCLLISCVAYTEQFYFYI